MRSSRPVRHLCSFRRDFVRRPFRLLRGNCGHLFCPIRSALKCAVYRNFRCRAFFSQPVRTCPSLLRADARDVSGIRENYRSGQVCLRRRELRARGRRFSRASVLKKRTLKHLFPRVRDMHLLTRKRINPGIIHYRGRTAPAWDRNPEPARDSARSPSYRAQEISRPQAYCRDAPTSDKARYTVPCRSPPKTQETSF